MQQNRSKKLLQWNIIVSMFIQVLSLVINLISKRVICLYLNVEYLGLQSLYSNFCDVLSFAYFGAGTAMLFSFYGPLVTGDKERLAALYRHYNAIYKKMTWIVSSVGIVTTVVAVLSVNADISDVEVMITFLTFMLSTVLYNRHMVRNFFIQADQRRYFVAGITGGVDLASLAIQILVLKVFRSYEAFIICILIKNLLINYIFGRYLKSKYSYLFTGSTILPPAEAEAIKHNVVDMVMYRFGKVLISNTDSIFISSLISTAMVGIYSNYQFIILGISSLVSAFYEAIKARVGQQMTVSKKENQYRGFQMHSFLNSWMAGVTIICFYYLVQDFIKLWMGSVPLLAMEIIIILLVNYYLEICRYTTRMYMENAGLFNNAKSMILIKGGLNIVLSYFMGKAWGIGGILIATTIAAAVTLFWYEPYIIYRYFKKSFVNEIYYQFTTFLQMAAAFVVTGIAIHYLPGEGMLHFLVKAVVCGIVVNVCYGIFYLIYKWIKQGEDRKRRDYGN